jgi:integrase
MPKHLQKRRRLWYAVLDIPKAQHEHFGKRKFIQSLETDSQLVAEGRVLSVVANWKKQTALAKNSGDGSGNALLDTVTKVRQDAQRLEAEGWNTDDIQLVHEDVAYNRSWDEERGEFVTDDEALASAVSVVHSGSLLLAEHIDEYFDSKTTEQKSKDMARRDLLTFFKQFPFPEDATRQKVIKWINVEVDSRSTRKLSLATKSRIISNCRVYWDWLEYNKGLTQDPPFTKVLPPKPKKKSKAEIQKLRKAFRVRDYHKLLQAAPEGDLRDLIMLGAYTGCRIAELCNLKIGNVDTDRMEILDAKSQAGWRTIPIHTHIAQLVARLVDTTKDGYLINGLTFNMYGDRSNAISKRFGRLKKSLDYGEDYVFHSFRKGFATQLENANIPLNVSARLMGHEISGETFGNYSEGLAYQGLKAAISHIDWK